jgi:hypothetical protein
VKTALAIVIAWHTALNTSEVDRLVALVTPDVEIGGPRGSARGAQIVREWFGRANVQLHPLRAFQRDDQVVIEERGEWHAPTGEITGTQTVATHFVLSDNLISLIMRYDDLATALNAAGLSDVDEVSAAH